MWFAALDPRGASRWLNGLLLRILQGEPRVLRLLGANPFPDHPPPIVHLVFYRYEFTTMRERRATGAWWKRTRLGATQAISLRDLQHQE